MGYYGSEPEELTYLVVMTGFVEDILSGGYIYESSGRSIIDIDEFIAEYQAGNREYMRRIVLDAKKIAV